MSEWFDGYLGAWESEGQEAETIAHIDGFYVGMLDPEEMIIFERGVQRGWCRRSYNHAGGLLGLAKVENLLKTKPE